MTLKERIASIKLARDCNPKDRVIVISEKRFNLMNQRLAEEKTELDEKITKMQEERTSLD